MQHRGRGPMGRGMQPGEKPKDLKGSLGKLLSYIGNFKAAIIVVMIFAAASTVFNVIGPKTLGKATTALSEGLMAKIQGTGSIDFTYIGQILLFVLGLYVCSAAFNFIQGWIMTGVTQKICYRMRKEISGKINRMPMKYFESRTYGEVLSRITNDVDTLGQGLNQSITTIITSVATLVGVLIMMFVGNLGYAAVALSGGLLAIRGTITIGDIQAFIQYVKNFTQPIQQIAQVINQVQSMAAASERVFEFLNEEEEDQTVEHPADVSAVTGTVDFDHVQFGYNPDQTIIKDFSAHVKPGQKIAIVGPTGAGKTTMVKLLMRFYDVNSGSIKLDGHDVRDFNRRELRDAFGMVLQDTWLFKGTIMENIRYGRLEATDEEVIAAAKAAHADHFIKTLPGGYQMELNEDASNVSQGQKQLLTIARAILADNKILILDEATSSVDTRTEVTIQKAMDNLMRGRTSFVIAHRLSTIRNADLILVMKDGDIVEQGNHEELLEKNGFYANLYNSQFEDVVA